MQMRSKTRKFSRISMSNDRWRRFLELCLERFVLRSGAEALSTSLASRLSPPPPPPPPVAHGRRLVFPDTTIIKSISNVLRDSPRSNKECCALAACYSSFQSTYLADIYSPVNATISTIASVVQTMLCYLTLLFTCFVSLVLHYIACAHALTIRKTRSYILKS